jgi:Domain of unknown function (DUF4118)
MAREDTDLVWIVSGSLGAMALGIVLIPFRTLTVASNLAFVFLVFTIIVAELGGRAAGLATAVVSSLSLNFFLTTPYLSLTIHQPDDVIAFVALAVSGLVAAAFGLRRARSSELLGRTRHDVEALAQIAEALGAGAPLASVLEDVRRAFRLGGLVLPTRRWAAHRGGPTVAFVRRPPWGRKRETAAKGHYVDYSPTFEVGRTHVDLGGACAAGGDRSGAREQMIPYLADGIARIVAWEVIFAVGMSVGAQRPLLVLSPILAETLARAGLSKQDVQRQLFQHARIPARQFERSTGEWTNLLPGRPSLRDLVKRGRAAAVFRGIRRSGAAGAGRGEGRGHHDRRQRRPVAHQRLRVLPQRDPRLHDIRRVTRHLRRRACYSIEPARCSRRRVRGQTSHLDDTRAPKHARWSAGAALCGPGHSGTRSRSSSASGSGISVRGNVGHASRPSPVALGIRWRCTCGMDC